MKQGISTTVIIPTYNRVGLLVQALDSVLNQTRPPDDVVVVDDGSTDGTAATLKHYGDRIRYLYQQNAGKAAAINRAMETVTSDYVWILDDDDVALPDALECHLTYLVSHPDVDFSYSGLYAFDGEQPPPPLAQCTLWQYADVAQADLFIYMMENAQPNHQTLLVPRACYDAIRPLDETLTFCEDYDIILRLARRFRGGRLQRPTVFLRRHSGIRGPAHECYAADERRKGWLTYEKIIFTKLYQMLALKEYLPRTLETGHNGPCQGTSGALSESEMRRAQLQRACIMAHHGAFAEALEDLDSATAGPSHAPPFTLSEQALCRRMLNLDSLLKGQDEFVRSVGRLLRERAPNLHAAAAAGFTWRFRRDVRAGSLRSAALIGIQLFRFAAPRDLVNIYRKASERWRK